MKAGRKVTRAARQLYRLCLVEGALDEGRARLVAERVAGSGRRGVLPVLAAFQRLVRIDRDRHTVLVESATVLEGRVRQELLAGLARTYGARTDVSFEQNPALIGGVRIRVGSDVYDGSVRGRLARLEERL